MSDDEARSKISAGKQWTNIANRLGNQELNLANFRRTREFFLFSTFDPDRFGLIYLRTLIWTLYRAMDPQTRAVLGNIKNRTIGDPHSIFVDGERTDLDYVVAAYETRFVSEVAKKVKSVVEIGAGYGRTCHALLSNMPNVREYWILDLPLMLDWCRRYLEHALERELFERIHFVDVTGVEGIAGVETVPNETLAVNINSLAEMDIRTVRAYLDFIDARTTYFFSSNTVGKYRPEDVGERSVRQKDLSDATRSGPLPHSIDIFDIDDVLHRSSEYRAAYQPSDRWSVRAESESPCYPHYRQIIYCRDGAA